MDVVTHVLLADGEPLLVSELWRPQRSPLDAGDVAPLLGLQAPRDGIEVRDESMLPAVATKQTCGALKLPDGAAVFSAEQLIEI